MEAFKMESIAPRYTLILPKLCPPLWPAIIHEKGKTLTRPQDLIKGYKLGSLVRPR